MHGLGWWIKTYLTDGISCAYEEHVFGMAE